MTFQGVGADGTDLEVTPASLPVPTVTLTQMDGAPPFDPTGSVGGDSDATNGVVRSGDLVAFVIDIDPGPTGMSGASVTLPVWRGLELDTVPAFCGPGSDLVHTGVVSVLTCALGELAPGQPATRAVTVTASAAAAVPGAVISTSATLTATSPATLVTSNPTQLEFLPRPVGCDAKDSAKEQLPHLQASEDRLDAGGRIADSVLDARGVPVPGAIVTLTGEDRCGDLIERRVTATESGRFAFVGLVAGLYRVTASAPADGAGIPRRSPVVTVSLSEQNMTATGLDLRLTETDTATADGSW